MIGALTIGADTAPFSINLPPNVGKFGINAICPSSCLSKVIIKDLFIKFGLLIILN
jgi:hypothetical protein